MTAKSQSRNQKQSPHRHGTTTTRIGSQPIGFFNAVLFFMFGTWPKDPAQAGRGIDVRLPTKSRSPALPAAGLFDLKPLILEFMP